MTFRTQVSLLHRIVTTTATTSPDILIIGAGASGGAAARALAPSGASVLLVERGERLPREAENWQPALLFSGEHYTTTERWRDGRSGRDFRANMWYAVGGNTKVYGAAMLRMRPRDFEAVSYPEGLSPAWPIGYADLAPYYDRAEADYAVHGTSGSDPLEPPRSGRFPYPALPHDPTVSDLCEALHREGVQAFDLPMSLRDAYPGGPFILRELFDRIGEETFDGYPDLTRRKGDAETCGVDPALNHDNVNLLTGARVTRLIPSRSGMAVETVEAEIDGAPVRFTPGVVILAAGAINSAALLLRSATDDRPEGLANSSGRVGRHFMRHTTSKFFAVNRSRPYEGFFHKTLAVNDYYWGNSASDHPDVPLGHIHLMGKHNAEMLRGDFPDMSNTAREEMARHSLDWWAQSEDLPLDSNRVTVGSDNTIELHYTPTNLEAHARLMDALEAPLRRIGYSEFLHRPMPLRVVNHQCGTLRMSTTPRTGVVTPEGQVHDLNNVFVADSSVFPSSAATNPTLTIVAWAYRLADHIAAERL